MCDRGRQEGGPKINHGEGGTGGIERRICGPIASILCYTQSLLTQTRGHSTALWVLVQLIKGS